MNTRNCILCCSNAEIFTGHVLYGKEKIMVTAGWCKNHIHKSEDMSLMHGVGCFGIWKPGYGLMDTIPFNQKNSKELLPDTPLHKCKYCGAMTEQPDEDCYKAPHHVMQFDPAR